MRRTGPQPACHGRPRGRAVCYSSRPPAGVSRRATIPAGGRFPVGRHDLRAGQRRGAGSRRRRLPGAPAHGSHRGPPRQRTARRRDHADDSRAVRGLAASTPSPILGTSSARPPARRRGGATDSLVAPRSLELRNSCARSCLAGPAPALPLAARDDGRGACRLRRGVAVLHDHHVRLPQACTSRSGSVCDYPPQVGVSRLGFTPISSRLEPC